MKNLFKNILFSLCVGAAFALPFHAPSAGTIQKIIQSSPEELPMIDTGVVTEVLKSTLIRVDDDVYALDNVRVPVHYDSLAKEFIERALLNKKVKVHTRTDETGAGVRTDRNGNFLTHIVLVENGEWLQRNLIGNGLAWATSTEKSRDLIRPLQAAEDFARKRNLGFWENPSYAIRNDKNIKDDINSFQILQGRIQTVTIKDETIFFNFGDDWKTDFTVQLTTKNAMRFFPKSFKAADLTDALVRVRGWVTEENGPMMELTHPEQWEVAKKPTAPPPPPVQ